MANSFGSDSSCKALWRFESGALGVDTIGTNTLNLIGSPGANTSLFKEGAASIELVKASTQYAYIHDAALVTAGFPLNSTDTVKKITVCGWFYGNTLPNYAAIWAKSAYYANKNCLQLDSGTGGLRILWGNGGSSTTSYSLGFTVSTGTWYHVTVVVDGVNKILQVLLYNASTGTYQYYSTSPGSVLGVGTADWMVGNAGIYPSNIDGNQWDGEIDELVVFNRLLSLGETENIINQVYTGPYAAASPGNVFTGDSRFQARWRFESGALTTDSSPAAGGNGVNTLPVYGTSPVADPFGAEEGADAAYLGGSNAFQIADTSLSANFPLKSGDSVKKITVCGWVIPTAWGQYSNSYFKL